MGETGAGVSLLARDALEWLLVRGQGCGTGLAWTGRPDDDELDPTLYSGAAGIVLALLEGYRHFGDDRYGEAAELGARSVAAAVGESWELSSLYTGLAGMAFALREVHRVLGDSSADQAADRALGLVRSRFDGERWSDQFELLGGNAGIALAAWRAGDLDLAVMAVTPYLRRAEVTAGGVHWEVRARFPARSGPGRPVLAHCHPVRPSAPAAAGILGQQRPLLRHSRRPGPGLRPGRRAARRSDLRAGPGR